MKQFLKVFFPLAAMVLGIQLSGALVFRWTGGTVIQYPIPIIFMLSCFTVPGIYLSKTVGKVAEHNGVLIPLLPCSFLAVYFMAESPKPLWIVLFIANLCMIAIAAFIALYLRKVEIEHIVQERDAFKKMAASSLNRFKSSYNKQYIVISNVGVKDVLYEMTDGCVLFQLPDNRLFLLVKQPYQSDDFEFLIDDFRNEADDDWDVLGYIDNVGSGKYSMFISDIIGSHQRFEKGDSLFIPFDYSLLEKAHPIPPAQS
jgi:hypothetical protein